MLGGGNAEVLKLLPGTGLNFDVGDCRAEGAHPDH